MFVCVLVKRDDCLYDYLITYMSHNCTDFEYYFEYSNSQYFAEILNDSYRNY